MSGSLKAAGSRLKRAITRSQSIGEPLSLELRARRSLLTPPAHRLSGPALSAATRAVLEAPAAWRSLRWQAAAPAGGGAGAAETRSEVRGAGAGLESCGAAGDLEPQAGALVTVVGPSGSGKTTLLDRFCGLLGEERGCWQVRAGVWS